jgi:predicted nucleic acid-binding protein
MKEKVFVDTDIILDLLASRMPHYEYAAKLFTLADHAKISISVSSLSFSNLLSKQYGKQEALGILREFKVLVSVLGVDDKIIDLALNSSMSDFEEAIQYHTALQREVDVLLTRNLRDYKVSGIPVMTAESYVKTFG